MSESSFGRRSVEDAAADDDAVSETWSHIGDIKPAAPTQSERYTKATTLTEDTGKRRTSLWNVNINGTSASDKISEEDPDPNGPRNSMESHAGHFMAEPDIWPFHGISKDDWVCASRPRQGPSKRPIEFTAQEIDAEVRRITEKLKRLGRPLIPNRESLAEALKIINQPFQKNDDMLYLFRVGIFGSNDRLVHDFMNCWCGARRQDPSLPYSIPGYSKHDVWPTADTWSLTTEYDTLIARHEFFSAPDSEPTRSKRSERKLATFDQIPPLKTFAKAGVSEKATMAYLCLFQCVFAVYTDDLSDLEDRLAGFWKAGVHVFIIRFSNLPLLHSQIPAQTRHLIVRPRYYCAMSDAERYEISMDMTATKACIKSAKRQLWRMVRKHPNLYGIQKQRVYCIKPDVIWAFRVLASVSFRGLWNYAPLVRPRTIQYPGLFGCEAQLVNNFIENGARFLSPRSSEPGTFLQKVCRATGIRLETPRNTWTVSNVRDAYRQCVLIWSTPEGDLVMEGKDHLTDAYIESCKDLYVMKLHD